MLVIKKYSNRRLYDTNDSGYITLDELADKIRKGSDVRVIDAKTNEDLTQVTLTQIILDSRGAAKLLPTELLTQLIRMGDEALAEFLGKYMTWALEMYLSAKRGAQAVQPYFPLATMPFTMTNALARMMSGQLPWGQQPAPPGPPVAAVAPAEQAPARDELAAMRRELDELKQSLKKNDE